MHKRFSSHHTNNTNTEIELKDNAAYERINLGTGMIELKDNAAYEQIT